MSVSVVRHLLAPTAVLALIALAESGCSSATTTAGTVSGVDSITTDATYTGTMFAQNGTFQAFDDSNEVEVGDLDSYSPKETMRGLVTFDLPTFASTTIKSAELRVYECAVFGTPFTSLGTVVIDHVTVPLNVLPAAGLYTGQTIASDVGTIAPDLNTGFKYLDVTSSVQNDISNSLSTSGFRLRFSIEDGNNNGVSDYVDFNTAYSGDCTGNATLAPLLIVTD